MATKPHSVINFYNKNEGAVTTEFVIVFPVVLALILFIAFTSLLIASISDLQQIAHELARGSLRHSVTSEQIIDICTSLSKTILPALLEQSFFLDPVKIKVRPCPSQPDGLRSFTVFVDYSFAGDYLDFLGETLGVKLGGLTRSSTTYW